MSYVFLIGRPCAGKDVVSSFIVEEYGYRMMTGSDIVRKWLLNNSSDMKAFYSGYIVNEKEFIGKLIEEVNMLGSDQIVFNGIPRTLMQLDLIFKYFTHVPKLVILMNVGDDDVFNRSFNRVVCSVCNKSQTYSGSLNCGMCLSEYSLCKRVDDTDAVVRRRMNQYYEHTSPVVSKLLGISSYDKDSGLMDKTYVKVVNCSNNLNVVIDDVRAVIREYIVSL